METIGNLLAEKLDSGSSTKKDDFFSKIEKLRLEVSQDFNLAGNLKTLLVKKLQKAIETSTKSAIAEKKYLELTLEKLKKDGNFTDQDKEAFDKELQKNQKIISKLDKYRIELEDIKQSVISLKQNNMSEPKNEPKPKNNKSSAVEKKEPKPKAREDLSEKLKPEDKAIWDEAGEKGLHQNRAHLKKFINGEVDTVLPEKQMEALAKLKEPEISKVDPVSDVDKSNLSKSVASKLVKKQILSNKERNFKDSNEASVKEDLKEVFTDEIKSAKENNDTEKLAKLESRVNEEFRNSEKAKESYKPHAEKLQRILNNERYQSLKAKGENISEEEKKLLDVYEQEKLEIETKLNELGPSGMQFVNLEIERANLAKASQEFQKSFRSKFPGAKILGVMAGMFGSKWSALQEGENTKSAKTKMDDIQSKYDLIRHDLMNTLVEEEYSVRKIMGQDFKNLSVKEKIDLESWIGNLNEDFIKQEHAKLDDLKHVLESTVRGSAMRRFGDWYSKDFMNFGPLKDNVRARNVAKRIVSAGVLSAALLPFSGAGAAGYFGYRMIRAGIGGVVGEGLAAGIARGFGGKMNEKGEFEKLAKKRDEDLEKSKTAFVQEMMQKFKEEEKPKISMDILDKLKNDHKKAVGNYMNSQGNIRRAEMWARIVAGGATAYSLSDLSFNDAPVPDNNIDNIPEEKIIIEDSVNEPEAVSQVDDFALEGDFVEASSQGFIKTFMDLKKEMIEHYRGLDTDSNYAESAEFADLTDDEIVQKLLDTGRFDDLTGDILRAKTLPEFMKVAEDHGFWKPEGWGNDNIDSGSVPKGSIVGMDWDPNGEAMQLYIKLPDGTKIPMDDNFQEVLNKKLGISIINTDGGTQSPKVQYNGPTRLPGTGGVELPDPDMDLEQGDYAPDLGQGDPNSSDRPTIREGAENPNNISTIDDQIAKYKTFVNPGSEHDFYLSKGFHEKGLMGTMRGSNEDVTTEYYDDAGNFYYTERAAVYETYRGGPHDIKNSPMYKEYHMLKTNYDIAQQEIIRLESLRLEQIRIQTQTMYEQGQMGQVGPSPEEIAAYENAVNTEAAKLSTKWIDAEFEKDPWIGRTTPGEETKAWLKFKDDKVFDHIKNPEDYDDTYYDPNDKDEIRFKGTQKEKNFLESLFIKMSRYNIKAGPEETVSELLARVADAEARTNLAK